MDDLQNHEYLSLVSRICTEFDNHLGIKDKDLAEFIIHMAQSSDSYDLFRRKLEENDAEISESFSKNLYRIIQTMSSTQTGKSMIENKNNHARQTEQSRQLTNIAIRKAICPVLCKPDDSSVRVSQKPFLFIDNYCTSLFLDNAE
jgi:hypothetical protein